MRPDPTEYSPYYGRYIDLVQGDILLALDAELNRSLEFYGGISEENAAFRYADGKWSIREVLGHVIDAERVFAYRALRFGRNDDAVLSSMDQDVFMSTHPFHHLTLQAICQEFAAVRQSTLHLFRNMPAGAWDRKGSTGENHMTVRSVAFIIAGHDLHHRDVVRTRYLTAIQ
ncbi:MAG: DinB family protein [Acidobacteria bacterium]|nr:DinB family protein [Acidobacteriota bacterium]